MYGVKWEYYFAQKYWQNPKQKFLGTKEEPYRTELSMIQIRDMQRKLKFRNFFINCSLRLLQTFSALLTASSPNILSSKRT
jgi:hypothetical protein